MGVNVEDGMVKNAASKLGCLVLKTPFTYLGTKVGGNMSRKQAWKEVVDKVLSRLSRWKMKLLSIGGRLTLLKSRDPKSNKASWVKWNKVLTPKDKGGLGVSSLFALNRGLMLKWVWRFYYQKCSLWTKVIKAIYREDGNLNKDVSGGVRTCWTSIVHEACIKELFPRMFALELNKNATVSSKLNASSLDNSFRRKARSGIEEMQLNSLAEISRMTTLVPCEDLRQIMHNISSWWNIDYSDVNSYVECKFCLVCYSDSIQTQQAVLEGVSYGFVWYKGNFAQLLFDKKIPEKALIFDNLVSSSFYWCKFRCKASFKRQIRYDEDEDENDQEYGHNEEIAMLEFYSQIAHEALLVKALVDDQEVEVLIFKGFSSSLSSGTPPDPTRSILPARAVIKCIDRVKGPFDPSNIEYIEKDLTVKAFEEVVEKIKAIQSQST
ncbi:hypothetical protein Tco_0533768 [Tanacetum coccineum]